MSKRRIWQFILRVLVINVVFFAVKFTMEHSEPHNLLNPTSLFYYCSAFFLFMVAWESNDYLIRRQLRSSINSSLNLQSGFKVLLVNLAIILPICALVYYIGIFHFNSIFHIVNKDCTPIIQFWQDFLRAALLGFTAILFNLFYHALQQKKEIEHQMNQLTKELITSKYNSLKDQISPHFLFNSLNTLTSLMYEDRDLASDFVSRLASCYRYILDHREDDLISLEKELSFLDSYMFMMNIRHTHAIHFTTHITTPSKEYVIPTLSLQMLVENALKHNYYSKEHPLQIHIFVNNDASIRVENTLRKRSPEKETTQLGISNIKKRYAFYTTEKVDVHQSETLFTVTLPLLAHTIKNNTPQPNRNVL